MTAAPSRPRDVALAAMLTILGSVLALAGIFSAQGQLRSSQVRGEIEQLLSDERFATVDISIGTVLNAVEAGLMVASAASVAAIVLAVFVLRRHNPSRIALTLLGGLAAVFVLVSGLPGVAIAVFVAYTVSLLWRAPARLWFTMEPGSGEGTGPARQSVPFWGGPPADRESSSGLGASGTGAEPPRQQPPRQQPPAPAQPPASDPGSTPEATAPETTAPEAHWPGDPDRPNGPHPGPYSQQYPQPWPPAPGSHTPARQTGRPDPPSQSEPYDPAGAPPPGSHDPAGTPSGAPPPVPDQTYGAQHGYPHAYTHGYGYPPGYFGHGWPPADPHRRPAQVVAAHVLTWIGAGLGLITALFIVIAAGSQEVLDLAMRELAAGDISQDEFVLAMRIGGGLTALWSIAVLVASVFSWRRANWAMVLLTVMGGAYLVMQLVSLLATGQLAVIVTIAWVTAVIVLLWWPTSRHWYTSKPPNRPGPPAPPSPDSPYPQQQSRTRNRPW